MSDQPAWFKSSYSDNTGADCVEVAVLPRRIHVRDSKLGNRLQFTVPPTAWADFIGHIAAP
ncbi:DUF397 domain-containing protein [Streptomyces morookaense]|uniref:DUF397 domain-containing protein n=1 Tax=Streptomyces morookaense TaxID=1970 RepID=A0A7Y7B6Z3_STRMO|nr:DUF397 domain-containing protein [Streptomyces morookaense]NVK80168.1 DUF397 domain-containing protein [Streptomyces morookaense]GHF29145.1 hypothetical protein GCM10010359_34520 [Streptomyces morookaense]